MNKDQTTTDGERTQEDQAYKINHNREQQSENLERGGMLFNGKTAKEWFGLHEVIRHDYARIIGELEAQDREIKKHEELEADRQKKCYPHEVG